MTASGLEYAGWHGEDLGLDDIHPSLDDIHPSLAAASDLGFILAASEAPLLAPWPADQDLHLEDVHPPQAASAKVKAPAPPRQSAGLRAASGLDHAAWHGEDLGLDDIHPSLAAASDLGFLLAASEAPRKAKAAPPRRPTLSIGLSMTISPPWGYDRVGRGYDVCKSKGGEAEPPRPAGLRAGAYTPARYEWGYDRVGRGYDVCRLGPSSCRGRAAA